MIAKLRDVFQGTPQNQLGSSVTYNADDRTNQVIVLADPRQQELFAGIIAKLDVAVEPDLQTEVIYLRNAKAADVVTVLARVVAGQNAATERASAQSVVPGQAGARAGNPSVTPATYAAGTGGAGARRGPRPPTPMSSAA